jgi:hypothetical protein
MKIKEKVQVLWLAFDGLVQRDPLNREHIESLYEFQNEIAEYFKKHLPKQDRIYGNGVIVELQDITDSIFKNPKTNKIKALPECLGRLLLAATFIPDSEQDV